MAKKYLDTDGLTRVFSKMKALVSDAENAKRAKAAVITTAGTGAAYTATVPGVTELYTGLTITIIPHTVSTTTRPTLNVNSLGAKTIRQPLSTNTGGTVDGASVSWLTASKPVTVRYDGAYWTIDKTRPDATNLYGTVPVNHGGTGNTSVDTTPTSGSTKMVTSGGVFDALQSLQDSVKFEVISSITLGSGTTTVDIPLPAGYKLFKLVAFGAFYTVSTDPRIYIKFSSNISYAIGYVRLASSKVTTNAGTSYTTSNQASITFSGGDKKAISIDIDNTSSIAKIEITGSDGYQYHGMVVPQYIDTGYINAIQIFANSIYARTNFMLMGVKNDE